MAGTDEDAVADGDDALYVLTAVLLTPAKFPSALGDDYPEACATLGLPPLADGYGLVLGQDGQGARWTVVIDDVSLVAVAIASWDCGMEYDLSPSERTVVAALPGWPLAVAVAAPGVPAPHDPAPEIADSPALSPPDTATWGPAQRRLGADEIALRWALWREQIDDTEFAPPRDGTGADSGTEVGDRAEGADEAGGSDKADVTEVAHGADRADEADTADRSEGADRSGRSEKDAPKGNSGIRRVLAEVRAYVDTPPPLGRVRSSFAPGDARTLRADGPGWSLVARTDDIAFVLLDEQPGEVVPVGRGPELPGLLEALDKMAVRPL
ncbi:hypothetical protein OG352_03820 [Streptomyces sp. NBC_01485]|uniref:hypothetical protein n=1 Tax=Streptomyces sp. NBC_01485 TaxID=2903884 RepID=UPI002E359D75|nr:hypothetical protein [Streptomyces sp. NBC_01485]